MLKIVNILEIPFFLYICIEMKTNKAQTTLLTATKTKILN